MNKNYIIKKGTINMKKLTALFLSLAMVLSLAACGTSSSNETSTPETSTPSASSKAQEPIAAPESTELAASAKEPSSQLETEDEQEKPWWSIIRYWQHRAGGKLYRRYHWR